MILFYLHMTNIYYIIYKLYLFLGVDKLLTCIPQEKLSYTNGWTPVRVWRALRPHGEEVSPLERWCVKSVQNTSAVLTYRYSDRRIWTLA